MSNFSKMMVPLLEVAKDGKEVNLLTVEKKIAEILHIPVEELSKLKPSGNEPLFRNRLRWARLHLNYALLIKKTRTNCYMITPRGKQVLKEGIKEITEKYLGKFQEYREKRGWSIKFERRWAMPNKWTFTMQPVAEILDEETTGFTIDPFAGKSTIADLRNDIDPKSNSQYHLDALTFLKKIDDRIADTVYYDGIYSPYQQKKTYSKLGLKLTSYETSAGYTSEIKNEISRVVKIGGKVISFGWNSNGMGIKRGFKITRIVLIPHGANHNDTIVTVERKLK